jgi:hypothetical protein
MTMIMKLIPMILKLPSPTGMKQQGSSRSDSQRQRESKNFGKRVMTMIMKLIPMILKLLDQGNLNLNRFRRNLLGLRKMKKVMALTMKNLKVLFNSIRNLKERKRKRKLPSILKGKKILREHVEKNLITKV